MQHYKRIILAIEAEHLFDGLYFLGGVQDGTNPWGGTYEGGTTLTDGPLFDLPALQQRLVLSPHVYGPDVRGEEVAGEGPDDMDRRFGFIRELSNAWGSVPIVPTEFGGYMRPGTPDSEYFERFLQYVQERNMSSGTFFWTFPETSYDTGGLLTGPDWKQLDLTKTMFLHRLQPVPTEVT
jgi:endoglucanase